MCLAQASPQNAVQSGASARMRRRAPLSCVALLLLLVPLIGFGGLRQQGTAQRRTRILMGGAMAAGGMSQAGAAGHKQYSQVADYAGYDGGATFDQPETLHSAAQIVSEGVCRRAGYWVVTKCIPAWLGCLPSLA